MANQGEFTSGGVTRVTSLPSPTAGLRGDIYYLSQVDGEYDAGHYKVKEDELAWGSIGGGGIGQVYITDVQPINGTKNTSNKVTSSSGNILDQFRTDYTQVVVHVTAIPSTVYMPTVEVNGINVANISKEGGGPEWNGSVTITLPGSPIYPDLGTITAEHGEGAKTTVNYELKMPPNVTAVNFTGGYPGSQTEVKSGQTHQVHVETDVGMSGIRVEAYGIRTSTQVIAVTAGSTSVDITATIANAHASAGGQVYGVRVTAHDADGSYGDTLTSSDTITVNNIIPSGNITVNSYSNGYSALASGDSANVTISASNYDAGNETITSPTGELNVTGTIIGSTSVGYLSGTYNVGTTNLSVGLSRAANATSATLTANVKIADQSPTITVTEPSSLISGPSGSNTTITINSNGQTLYQAPTLVAPTGVWQGGAFSGSTSVWTRSLNILDSDPKGTPSWGALNAINLAGKVVTTITGNADYVVSGFITRRLTFPAFGNDLDLGTVVVNTNRLQATAIGGVPFTYVANSIDNPGGTTYTITGGNVFHTNDSNWVNSNGTGTAYIDVLETAN